MIKGGDYKCPCDACKALGPAAPGITDTLALKLTMMEGYIGSLVSTQGYRLEITSGRRCAVHNAQIGGAEDSMHLTGLAADILAVDSSAHYALVYAATVVGIPFIEVSPHHVHIDLRTGPKRLITGPG